MAEFCLDYLRKLDKKDYKRWQVRLSLTKDLCEGCGEWKRVVMGFRGDRPWFFWWWR